MSDRICTRWGRRVAASAWILLLWRADQGLGRLIDEAMDLIVFADLAQLREDFVGIRRPERALLLEHRAD